MGLFSLFDYTLCLKHLRQHLALYDDYPKWDYTVTIRLVPTNKNEKCQECKEAATSAYHRTLMEQRK